MALQQMEVPESPKLYTKKYQSLLGVDFSCDITEVDQRRTPTGVNMISDEGANPIKRVGWRVIDTLPSGAGEILNLATMENDTDDATIDLFIFAIATHGIYRIARRNSHSQDTITRIYPSENDNVLTNRLDGSFVFFGGKLYAFLTEKNASGKLVASYIREMTQDGAIAEEPEYYVPEATINIIPNGTGGMSLEAINLLTSKRMYSFQGDGTSTTYYLYPKKVRTMPEYKRILNDVKVEVMDSNGEWQTMTVGTDYTLSNATSISYYDKNKAAKSGTVVDAKIVFTSTHEADASLGSDNVRITFTPIVMKHTYNNTVYDGEYKEGSQGICSARATAVYGHTTTDRVFVASGTEPNKVHYSSVNDITYFPDNNWFNVGYDTNEIQGMVRVSDYLAVIKNDSVYDNTMYLIRGSFLEDDMVFTVVPTSAKLGSIAPKSLKTLIDEPLFLTRSGVFGIANVSYSTEKTIRNRSRFLDKKLVKEPNLAEACSAVWNKYYLLCVNDHCYILDGRKQGYDDTGNTDFQYEAYYWENIPAKCFATFNEELYFASSEGKLCKFNTDVKDRTKYCDNGLEVWAEVSGEWYFSLTDKNSDDEVVADIIYCEWSTLLDDDGAPQYFKTLNKKGNLVTLLPQVKTSADVTLIKDGVRWRTLDTYYANIFDWSALNFAEFPFTSNITARDDFVRKKVKKYKRLQIIISNNGMFEPFGILGITKTYYYGNFAK